MKNYKLANRKPTLFLSRIQHQTSEPLSSPDPDDLEAELRKIPPKIQRYVRRKLGPREKSASSGETTKNVVSPRGSTAGIADPKQHIKIFEHGETPDAKPSTLDSATNETRHKCLMSVTHSGADPPDVGMYPLPHPRQTFLKHGSLTQFQIVSEAEATPDFPLTVITLPILCLTTDVRHLACRSTSMDLFIVTPTMRIHVDLMLDTQNAVRWICQTSVMVDDK
jgi:hypothetical protein